MQFVRLWAGGVARRNAARAVAAKKTRAVRPRYRLAPPVQRAGTHCVCATQPGALCGVCSL